MTQVKKLGLLETKYRTLLLKMELINQLTRLTTKIYTFPVME